MALAYPQGGYKLVVGTLIINIILLLFRIILRKLPNFCKHYFPHL